MGPTRVLGGVSFFSGYFLKTSLSHCTEQDLLLLSPARAAALCFMDLTCAPLTVCRLSVKAVQGGYRNPDLSGIEIPAPREGPARAGGTAGMCCDLCVCTGLSVQGCLFVHVCSGARADAVRAPGGFVGLEIPSPGSPHGRTVPLLCHEPCTPQLLWGQADSVLILPLLSNSISPQTPWGDPSHLSDCPWDTQRDGTVPGLG